MVALLTSRLRHSECSTSRIILRQLSRRHRGIIDIPKILPRPKTWLRGFIQGAYEFGLPLHFALQSNYCKVASVPISFRDEVDFTYNLDKRDYRCQ